jgi:glycosyltransferase involved in cell wall biosynthesis
MKSILFLTSRLPYPPIGGDRLKSYWLLKILTKHYRVHLVSIAEQEVPDEFYEWAKEIGLSFKIFQKTKHQFFFSSLKGLVNKLPLQVNYYYFTDVQHYVNEIYQSYDLLFSVLIRTARYVINKEKPKILEITDSIGLNYTRSKRKTYSAKWKILYTIEGQRLLNFERHCIEKFDKTLFVNRIEREFFKLPHKTEWLPNGVDENLLTYEKQDDKYRNYVAFFGKMNAQPNVDAVLWFTKNVLPYLNKNIRFIIVGAYPTKDIKNLTKKYKNVEITGFTEDPYIILKSSLCVVSPMQTGGGIQNKILESMALGNVNIVSSLAKKAIVGAEHKKHLFVCDDPREIATIINQIYVDPLQFETLKRNAREFIRRNYTWSVYEKRLLEIINNVLK